MDNIFKIEFNDISEKNIFTEFNITNDYIEQNFNIININYTIFLHDLDKMYHKLFNYIEKEHEDKINLDNFYFKGTNISKINKIYFNKLNKIKSKYLVLKQNYLKNF